jgi:MFS family permease
VIGDVLGVAVAGSLFGPAVGALADSVGTKVIFGSVLVLTLALSVVALRIPDPKVAEQQRLSEVREAILSRSVLWATWYVAAPSAMFGVVEVLAPLRMDELGGGAGLVAAGFISGAVIEAILAPTVGRLSDRIGRLRPYAAGMAISALAIALLPAAGALAGVFGVLIGISIGAGLCFAPALAMLSDSAEATHLHQGFAAGLINMAWASGQVLGGVGGGAAAGAAGDALPCLLAAGLLLATVAVARPMAMGARRRVRPHEAP